MWNFCVLCSHLRHDTLAQMLTLANIHAGSKVLVFETCSGLVLGAVMERMGGTSVITNLSFPCLPVRIETFLKVSISAFCVITLSIPLTKALVQSSKCTQEVSLFARVSTVLASLQIFMICCMNSPSVTLTLCWQGLWTLKLKTPILVQLALLALLKKKK